MRRVAIVGGKRIPFARSFSNYSKDSTQELMTKCLQALVESFNLQGQTLGEVALGAVIKHSSDWNFSREVTLGSGLSATTPAYDVIQACATSLSATISIANKIRLGQIESGIAGGCDTNSDLPFVFSRKFNHVMLQAGREKSLKAKLARYLTLRPADLRPIMPGVVEPRTGLSMGESCEKMAKEWKISREEQDELALASHARAAEAYAQDFFDDLIVPYNGLNKDNNLRADTSLDKLAKLKPAFDKTSGQGTLTAGNSSALSDGAAAILLASEEWAKERNLPVLAYLSHSESAAVEFASHLSGKNAANRPGEGQGLLMAPAYAVPRLLKKAGLTLQEFDFYEIHEAFAAQVLCTLKAWESEEFCRTQLRGLNLTPSAGLGKIDRTKMNVKGGSIALGHPFAATGARIVATLAKTLSEKGSGRGLISICTGGGMGVAAIVER